VSRKRIRGIGVDAVSLERMAKLVAGEHFVKRMFHPLEVKEGLELKKEQQAQFFASRFAAKEALVKALGTGFRGVGPAQICVVVDELGKPSFQLEQKVISSFNLENAQLHLSLTHEKDLACAFVIVEDFS
jgi:holo-[acyl-carrier protein] synthase